MQCQNCGQQIPDNSTVCTLCGAVVTPPVAADPTYPPSYGTVPPAYPTAPADAYQAGYQMPPAPDYSAYQMPPQGYPAVAYQPGVPMGYEQKSKLAAGLLGIFLGAFGVGRFYLGYAGLGVAQLLVSIFTFGIGGLWGFIDGILILTGSVKVDAQGIPLKD